MTQPLQPPSGIGPPSIGPERIRARIDGRLGVGCGPRVAAVARRKDALFAETLEEDGVQFYPGTVLWIQHLRDEGLRTAIVSAKRGTGPDA